MPYIIPGYNPNGTTDIDVNLTPEEKKARKAKFRKAINMAIFAGEIMLQSGAETYRVEDTIIRLSKAIDIVNYVDVFVIPTGIFLTIGYDNNINTIIKRTQIKSIDLNKITLVNEFSRDFTSSDMTVNEAVSRLKRIANVNPYKNFTKSVLGGGLIGGFYALLFKGTPLDFLSGFFVSMLVVQIREIIGRKINVISYVKDFIGALLSGVLALLFVRLGLGNNIDIIIIGSIMPLVPGFAITNATRDSVSGDYLAGVSRALEAVLSALSIALGVGLAIKYQTYFN